jgi:hypothetical protein
MSRYIDKSNVGKFGKPTLGLAIGRAGRQAVLGLDGTYSKKNYKGYLINQGIGNITGTYDGRAFSDAFSQAFS